MAYADITLNDKNPFKRFLQRRRLSDALSLVRCRPHPRIIVDFGAGDGEFCRRLANRYPEAKILCYEPTVQLRQEAVERLKELPQVAILDSVEQLPLNAADWVFCMEVFEHLPAKQTADALAAIRGALSEQGIAIIGVPVEILFPALLKGVFRMTRRLGSFDTGPKNILHAAFGRPPQDRPIVELAADAPYYHLHLGFDHRKLQKQLEEQYRLQRVVASPLKFLPFWLNSEVYFIAGKK
jgi:SAM-dependent methyltransferase